MSQVFIQGTNEIKVGWRGHVFDFTEWDGQFGPYRLTSEDGRILVDCDLQPADGLIAIRIASLNGEDAQGALATRQTPAGVYLEPLSSFPRHTVPQALLAVMAWAEHLSRQPEA